VEEVRKLDVRALEMKEARSKGPWGRTHDSDAGSWANLGFHTNDPFPRLTRREVDQPGGNLSFQAGLKNRDAEINMKNT